MVNKLKEPSLSLESPKNLIFDKDTGIFKLQKWTTADKYVSVESCDHMGKKKKKKKISTGETLKHWSWAFVLWSHL